MMGPMLKWFFALFMLVSLGLRAGLEDDWFDPAFIEANTLNAGTGFILVPSPEVIPGGVVSAAIHRYQVKVDYGLWNVAELGITADLDGYRLLEDGSRDQILYARARLLSVEKQGIGLSVGVDGVGFEDLGLRGLGYLPKAALENLERFYAVAGLPLPFYPSLMLSAGFGTGAMPAHYFFNLSKVVIPGLLAMGEYDGFGTNLGLRLLLSPRIKLDLDFVHTQAVDRNRPFADVLENNLRFGITYSEAWSTGLANLLPSGKKDAPKTAKPKP
jgi:hypothetical protein